jgi:hypothetical protein
MILSVKVSSVLPPDEMTICAFVLGRDPLHVVTTPRRGGTSTAMGSNSMLSENRLLVVRWCLSRRIFAFVPSVGKAVCPSGVQDARGAANGP